MLIISYVGTLQCIAAVPQSAELQRKQSPTGADFDPFTTDLQRKGIKTDTASLIKALQENASADIRFESAVVLSSRQEPGIESALVQAMKSDVSEFVRKGVSERLAMRGNPEARAFVKKFMIQSTELPEQARMGFELAVGGDPAGYKFVKDLALSKEPARRREGMQDLFPFFHFKAEELQPETQPAELLRTLLGDDDASVRKGALELANRVVPRFQQPATYLPLVTRISEEDTDPEVKEVAARLLKQWQQYDKKPRTR